MFNSFLKRYWWVLVAVVGLTGLGWWWFTRVGKQVVMSPEAPWIVVARPWEKYSFERLRNEVYVGSDIQEAETLWETDEYTAKLFYYIVDDERISGQINTPKGEPPAKGWPVVVMIRGYVDKEVYETGVGTKNGAGFFAGHGYVTVAPDFLGFGQSDEAPESSLEERFMRPKQVLELIESVKKMEGINKNRVNIWGHSNGGQIALSVAEIGGFKYPTVLWAPVSKPFPYSILYYTDEFEDKGKALRKVVAAFEALYNADNYSIDSYYDWIQAPIQIHQGTADDAVPLKWSVELRDELKELGKKVELYIYEGADHNLSGGWDLAVQRSLEFFEKNQ